MMTEAVLAIALGIGSTGHEVRGQQQLRDIRAALEEGRRTNREIRRQLDILDREREAIWKKIQEQRQKQKPPGK